MCCCMQQDTLQTCGNVACTYRICSYCIMRLKRRHICPHCQQRSSYVPISIHRTPIPFRFSLYFWLWGYVFFTIVQGEKILNLNLPYYSLGSHVLYGFIGDGIFFSMILIGSLYCNPTVWYSILY